MGAHNAVLDLLQVLKNSLSCLETAIQAGEDGRQFAAFFRK